MPQIVRDVFETLKEHGKKGAKEIVRAPVDIVKASFDQPIPNPSKERTQQIKAEEKAKLARVRGGLSEELRSASQQSEQPRMQQGAEMAERGLANQNAQVNSGQQLSASMTPKKKPEPLVVQQKRNNKLHGAG